MKITDLFNNKPIVSFEVFPPKKTAPLISIQPTLEELGRLRPDFISVTYGAGGNQQDTITIDLSRTIEKEYGIPSVAHLPCINFSRPEILSILKQLKENGIENILALRGDINPDIPPKHDFQYASDLVSFIRENGDFDIIGACYPEGHPNSTNIEEDILHLKKKVDSGVSHLISQLFFDNDYFYRFREMTARVGIDVPIEAGIMPVTNKRQIERMTSLCGATVPEKFKTMMAKYEDNPEAMRDAGIAYAIDQIVDLFAHDIDGVHIYTMNNSYVARRIHEATASLRK